jgi:predicted negative regulator of RcsB-dependent stress response
MFDTLAVAQQLAAGGVDRDQAEVIADAIRQGVEQGDHVTSDQFKIGVAEMRTEIGRVETGLKAEIGRVETDLRAAIADLKGDMKLLKFAYGPLIIGLLIKLAFFP